MEIELSRLPSSQRIDFIAGNDEVAGYRSLSVTGYGSGFSQCGVHVFPVDRLRTRGYGEDKLDTGEKK